MAFDVILSEVSNANEGKDLGQGRVLGTRTRHPIFVREALLEYDGQRLSSKGWNCRGRR